MLHGTTHIASVIGIYCGDLSTIKYAWLLLADLLVTHPCMHTYLILNGHLVCCLRVFRFSHVAAMGRHI
jgi:hypothetical protein